MATIFNQREDIELRRSLRSSQTETEQMLWNELRGSKLGIKFRRQFGIGPYVVDFYAPRARLVVEIDGSIHDLDEVRMNDLEKQKEIEGLGLKFLRFTTEQIMHSMDTSLSIILHSIQNPLLTKERAG